MKAQKSLITISLAPYAGKLLVATTKDAYCNQFSRWFKEKKVLEGQTGECSNYVDSNGRFRILLYAADTPSLVHELAHAVFYVFDHCGVEASVSNDEPYCYMLHHLFEQVIKRTKVIA